MGANTLFLTLLPLAFLALASSISASRNPLRDSIHSTLAKHGGFRVDLIHPESDSSPTRKSGSRSEKVQHLIAKSHARARFIAANSKRLIESEHSRPQDYESPLTPGPDGGGYIMEFTVGSPSQTFKAIADTGSDLVWVQSDPCSGCKGTVFCPKSSSTYKSIDCSSSLCRDLPEFTGCGSGSSCEYLYQYGSGETKGTFAQDTVTLGTTSGGKAKFPSFAVGCGTQNTGFDGAEGLVGLGQGPISLTSQLGSAIDHKFSYCLVDIDNLSASSPMFFGDSASLNGSGIQTTPIIPSSEYPSFYILNTTGISVAGGSSLGSIGTTMIDSGTTLTYISRNVYKSVVSKMEGLITLNKADGSKYDLDLCYDTSSNKNYKFPALSLTFQGATLAPVSKNYFMAVGDSGSTSCLAMGPSDDGLSILGNVMQQGYHILYDRGSSKLSFVKEDCSSLK